MLLNKSKIVFILLFLSISSVFAGGGGKSGGCGKGSNCGNNSGDCSSTKTATVELWFPATYSGRNYVIPEPGSDPDLVTHGTSLVNSGSTFYCVVTVTGILCPNYRKSYIWNVKSRSMDIPLPANSDFQLSVEFFERAGYWDSRWYGRPVFGYSRYYSGYQSIIGAHLVYSRTERW